MNKNEMITHITFDAAHLIAVVTTYQPRVWKHLEVEELSVKPTEMANSCGKVICKSFQIPKHWIHIHPPKYSIWKQRRNIGSFLKKFIFKKSF